MQLVNTLRYYSCHATLPKAKGRKNS